MYEGGRGRVQYSFKDSAKGQPPLDRVGMMGLDYAENRGSSNKNFTGIFCAALPGPRDFQIPGKCVI